MKQQAATIEELRMPLLRCGDHLKQPQRTMTGSERLRTLIVRELHPDNAPKGSADWAARTELFPKIIWPKVEDDQ